MPRLGRNTLIPLLLFPAISALAKTYIFGHIQNSDIKHFLEASCPAHIDPSEYPYRLVYTNFDVLDRILCKFVTFFQFAIQLDEDEPLPRLYTSYCLGNLLPILTITAIEMERYKLSVKGRWIRNPFLSSFSFIGAIYQVFTIAITIPIYHTMSILSNSKSQKDRLTKQHAEAVIFGLLMGFLVPSIGMLVLNDPHVTAIWQFFPIIVSLFRSVHLAVRRPSKEGLGDARGAVRMVYLTMGAVASSAHVALVWPKLFAWDIESIKLLMIPARLYGFRWTTAAGQAMVLLQWDTLFACISTIFWTFWLAAGGWRRAVKAASWYVVAVPLIGPGAAIAGIAIWREAE